MGTIYTKEGWLIRKKREKCKVETTKRDLEVVDGAEFKNVTNEKVTPPWVKISEETPQLLLKYHQKTQLPKTQLRVGSSDTHV